MLDLLALTRLHLGAPPRQVRRRLVRPAPHWAVPHGQDPTRIGEQVLRDGELVRSFIVNASRALFDPGDAEGFALVAHPLPGDPLSAEQLGQIASEVGMLAQRTAEDPDLDRIVQAMRSGSTFTKVPVPAAIARGARVFVSTVVVRPRDLPGRRLTSWFLPVLSHEGHPAPIVLPKQLWAPDLVAAWMDLRAEQLEGPPA